MINAVAVVQEFYRAKGAGDVDEHIAALLSPDLEWTGAESFAYYSGLWRGPQVVIDNLLLPLARDWDGFSAAVHRGPSSRMRRIPRRGSARCATFASLVATAAVSMAGCGHRGAPTFSSQSTCAGA
jgi:hypothetical protein